MAKINFVSLKCVRQQDVMGKDEVEILINGVMKWSDTIDKNETLQLKPLFEDFDGRESMTVTLRERNGSNHHKVLGTKTVTVGHPDPQPVDFKTSGAHYELRYTLT